MVVCEKVGNAMGQKTLSWQGRAVRHLTGTALEQVHTLVLFWMATNLCCDRQTKEEKNDSEAVKGSTQEKEENQVPADATRNHTNVATAFSTSMCKK